MTTNTPPTRRVKLKSIHALRRGDVIEPGMGLFFRSGIRMPDFTQASCTAAWGRDAYTVTGVPWMNAVPEMNVPVVMTDYSAVDTQSILHTPLDAYVVLAPQEK